MLYRKFGNTSEDISVLGFGCMRLPVLNQDSSQIDEVKATEMIHYAIDQGINYIDTAYPYHEKMSEPFVGRALAGGYREKVNLATKLPSWLIQTREDMDRYLDEQLERLQTDRIDFYLIHALNKTTWSKLQKLGVGEFLDAAIADGRIRYAGFSFHDGPDLFREIVDAYDWTFCQIQYNFIDENYQAGRAGLEYAAARGLGIIIMEPLRGGRLAEGIPAAVQEIWDKADVKRSPVEWGLRFLWDNPRIGIVLSGMTQMEHVLENVRIAAEALPQSLTEKEKGLLEAATIVYHAKIKVNCTTCQYCLPCPVGVSIPACFARLNGAYMFDNIEAAKDIYLSLGPQQRASACVECGRCETLCPQHIPIRSMLQEVVSLFES